MVSAEAIRADAPAVRTALYRHFDASGNLLYVGISLSIVARLIRHKASPWFPEIRNITITWFDSHEAAVAAEQAAIKAEKPKYNKTSTHHPRPYATLWKKKWGEILLPITKPQGAFIANKARATGRSRAAMLRVIIGEWIMRTDRTFDPADYDIDIPPEEMIAESKEAHARPEPTLISW